VRFDDRLRTVLAQPATDPHDRAVRWRQLVELAAKAAPEGDGDALQQAIEVIRSDSQFIDERVRTAAALGVARLAAPVELVAAFAADRLGVAAPILAGARLTASEWNRVSQGASEECRAFIATLRSGDTRRSDERPDPAQPPIGDFAQPPGSHPASPSPSISPIPSISEVVARIERLRSSRETGEGGETTSNQGDEAPRLFRWECNEAGQIDWVEGAPRGALVGHSIAHSGTPGGVDRSIERAFASRAPFEDGLLELPEDAVIGGAWKISGVPAFDRASGRFSGYRGIAERSAQAGHQGSGLPASPTSIRELAHEIRTPLNAIIGFAEIICGEYLGPADRSYRDRAARIVAEARQLLSAVEDLDLAARLRSSDRPEPGQVSLGQLVERLIDGLRESATTRSVELDAPESIADMTAAVTSEIAERLITRMCGAAIAAAAAGEQLRLLVDSDANHCNVSISRPESLKGTDLHPDHDRRAGDSAMLSIRLVMGLARTAGCELEAGDNWLTLRLPIA
jgi:hypothetical protein